MWTVQSPDNSRNEGMRGYLDTGNLRRRGEKKLGSRILAWKAFRKLN